VLAHKVDGDAGYAALKVMALGVDNNLSAAVTCGCADVIKSGEKLLWWVGAGGEGGGGERAGAGESEMRSASMKGLALIPFFELT
jgi:hypothetical protein